jgi:hypothetical protein
MNLFCDTELNSLLQIWQHLLHTKVNLWEVSAEKQEEEYYKNKSDLCLRIPRRNSRYNNEKLRDGIVLLLYLVWILSSVEIVSKKS